MLVRFASLILAFMTFALRADGVEPFVIHTEVFAAGSKKPLAENVTIFEEDRIIDFLTTAPPMVTVFETANRKFLLGLPQAKKKTALTAEELIRFAATEQTRALESSSELIRFAASPTFRESYDAKSGTLTLTSPHWDYRVETTRDVPPEILSRYGEFANWYTHLNALFRPVPPGVRLELNRALAQYGCLPTRVAVHIKGKTDHRQESRHRFVRTLTAEETKRLADWKSEEPKLEAVSLDAFRTALMETP